MSLKSEAGLQLRCIAQTEKIAIGDGSGSHEAFYCAIPNSEGDGTGRGLLDLDIEVDFFFGGATAGGEIDLFEIAGLFQSFTTLVHVGRVVKFSLGHREFPANHLVTGLRIPNNLNLFIKDTFFLFNLKSKVD